LYIFDKKIIKVVSKFLVAQNQSNEIISLHEQQHFTMGMSNVDLAQLNACLNNFLVELLHVLIWHKPWVLHIIR
jgi:hypothetical protein